MMMLAVLVALVTALLTVPYLGLASIGLAFIAICVAMLVIILGWAEKGASHLPPGAGSPSREESEASERAL